MALIILNSGLRHLIRTIMSPHLTNPYDIRGRSRLSGIPP